MLPPAEDTPSATAPVTREGELPLNEDGVGSFAYWQGEIESAQKQIDQKLPEWQKNLARYQNKPLSHTPAKDTVWVPKDYALTERKRSQLWFKTPDLYAQPKPGQTPQTAQAAPVFAAVVNQYLKDEQQFDADTMMTEVVFDAICPAGLMCSVIYYEAFEDGTRQVEVGRQPDPMNPLATIPLTKDVPNVICERYRWERFSPAWLLAPADWTGSKFDKAPWLGRRFELDREIAKVRFGLTDDDLPDNREPLKTLNESETKESNRNDRRVLTGVEIFYRASLFDPAVKHPDCQRWLVILDGDDAPIVHRESPYQTVTETGQLSGDSLLGFPIHVGVVRTIADGKFPQSDCQASRAQVDELSRGRSQMVQQRNRNFPMRAGDKTRMDDKMQKAILNGEYQEILLVDGPPNDILVEVARSEFPRENFAFNDQIEKDLSETWAIDSNQLGVQDNEDQTATEASIKQRNSDARPAKEQQNVKDYFLSGVQKCATLLQRFADATDYVEVVGPVGQQMLQQSQLLGGPAPTPPDPSQPMAPQTQTVAWNKGTVQGKFLWTIKPDSQLRLDMTQERQFRRQAYGMYRRDPLVNAAKLMEWVLEAEGLTGPQFLAQPQPPQEPPFKVAVSITGEDLMPMAPQYANVLQLLTVDGKPPVLEPAANPAPSIPHGGLMPGVEPMNKHEQDRSGKMPGPSGEQNTANV